MSLSGSLLTCAAELLWIALKDRLKPVFRMRRNHFTVRAVGSLLVLTAALEAWLNEVISTYANSPHLLELAGESIMDKYQQIPERLGGRRLPHDDASALMLAVRDEIAHFLPRRHTHGRGNVPPAFQYLQRHGLLINYHGTPGVDFFFTQKLHSYRLAYWAWEVVDRAVSRFVESLPRDQRLASATEMIAFTARNFKMYERICPPERLADFDAEHGLRITTPQRTGT